MTEGRRFGGLPFEGLPFENLVPWAELAGLAAAGRSLVPDVPAALARTVTEQLLGRRLTTKVDGADLALTLTELDYPADSLRLATGRIGDVRVVAENITWPERDPHPTDAPKVSDGSDTGGSGADAPSDPAASSRPDPAASGAAAAGRIPLRRVVVLAKDVRVRSLPTPSVIPAEVGLEIFVDGEVVRERVAALRPGIVATPHHDGLRLRSTRRPGWGHLTLEPTVEPEAVVLTPATLHIGRWKFRAPKRIRPIVLPLPELPKGLRLTGVRAAEGELVLNTVADEWPERLARIPLGDLLSWLTTAALTLTLPRLGTRS